MLRRPDRNLVLVHTPRLQARADFEAIRLKLTERAPDIEVFVVDNLHRHSVTRRRASRRPTLIFSPVALRELRPLRGKIYAGRVLTKMEEYRRLRGAGLPVPELIMLQPDMRLDPAHWGPFTVLKPNVGRQGQGVRLVRTRDVIWRDPFTWPRNDPRFGCQMLAQKFIDTGPQPISFRTFAVLGRVVHSTRNSVSGAEAFDRDPAATAPLDVPVAANHGDRHIELNFAEDIIDTARQVAAGLPDMPSLGIDLIREAGTGRVFVLEVNPSGLTWHLSSDYWKPKREKFGIDLYAQFGALDIIAEALIEVTRREAE